MARITAPLTNTQIKQAKPKEKEYSLNDGQGLALRIKPTGSKLWIFNYYQPFTKKRKNMGLGMYPDVSLASARQKRNEARQLVSEDIDPLDNREQQTDIQKLALGNTLEHIAKQWIDVKRSSVSDDHANKTWSSLELHIFPSLGKYPIDKLTAKKVIEQLSPIAAKGSLETIKRLCQRLNEIMIFAVNTGLIDSNPLSGIGKAFKTPEKQHLATIKPEELPALMQTLNRASIKRVTRHLIEWQLHTLTRPSEAAGARWDEIDIDNAIWVIPAERMKKRREHSIPLTTQTLEILEQIKPISGHREFVFPSDRNPHSHINSQTANMALKRMGYENKLVAHGLRALGSTILNEYGFDYDLVEAALAHVDKNEVRAAYNRADYIKRRIPMMEWWSEHIESSTAEGFTSHIKYELERLYI
jgi:integrase